MIAQIRISRIGIFVGAVLCAATLASGQQYPYGYPGGSYGGNPGGTQRPSRQAMQQQQQQQQLQQKAKTFKADGTVAAVSREALSIVIDGHPWLIQPDRNCKFQITGTADVSALRPNQFVRFQAQLDNQGVPTAPISQLEIVTPMSPAGIGVFPQGPAQPTAQPRNAKRAPAAATGMYLVVGKVVALKDRDLTVAAANRPMQVRLADAVKVGVDVADYSLARPGDKASVQGRSSQAGVAVASAISIVLTNPVGGAPGGTAAAGPAGAAAPGGAQPGSGPTASKDAATSGPALIPATRK